MTTALKLIERGFQKAGIKAAEKPLKASEIADGLDVLNDILNSWNATGVLKGIGPVEDTDKDLLEPDYASWALKATLAVMIAGEYGIEITQAMAADKTESMNALISATADLNNTEYPSTLPIGSGNRDQYGYGYDRDFFPENDKENF
jgi:hypothetical protein